MPTTLELAQANIRKWKADPVTQVVDLFGVTPDDWQVKVLRAFADPSKQRIAMQACSGPGKSAVLCWCGYNFLTCYADYGEHPKGAAISISLDNLRDNLWSEFSKWRERSVFLKTAFDITSDRVFARDHPKTWFISARSFQKTANPEEQGRTLSGLHAKFVLYLIDESGDINPSVLRSAEQGLSNCSWGKILQAGNPTSQDGLLYFAAAEQPHLWYQVRITGDPDDPGRSKRIDSDWAAQQIANYGRDNPWVMAYILGKFPPSAINALIGVEQVNAAMERHILEREYSWAQRRIGVDVARFGDDASTIFRRQGLMSLPIIGLRNADGPGVAARTYKEAGDFHAGAVFVDVEGVGASVEDALNSLEMDFSRVKFSHKANDPRFYNLRSEMLWSAAEWAKRGGVLAQDPQLKREMVAHTYTLKKGKIWVVEKDQVKKLIGCSPDRFDGLGLTFAVPDMPGEGPTVTSAALMGIVGNNGHQGQSRANYKPIGR